MSTPCLLDGTQCSHTRFLVRPRTKCLNAWITYADYKRNTILERSFDFSSNSSLEEIRHDIIVQQRELNALMKTVFEVCDRTMGDQLKYMGTTTVVRDIDLMAKALDGEDALMSVVCA